MDERTKADSAEKAVGGAAPDGGGKPSLSRLWPVLILVAGIVAFLVFGGQRYLSFEMLAQNRQNLMQWADAHMALAIVAFMLAYTLVVAFSLPGATWMTLAGGFLFGTLLSTVLVVVSATAGAVGIFLLARYALADFFRAKMGGAALRMEAGFKANALSYLLFMRLVPVFPFWLVNLVPAFLGVPLRTYVVGTLVGIVPGSAVYCSVGNGLGAVFDAGGRHDLGIIFKPEILGPIVALAALSLVPILYKRIKGGTSEDRS